MISVSGVNESLTLFTMYNMCGSKMRNRNILCTLSRCVQPNIS